MQLSFVRKFGLFLLVLLCLVPSIALAVDDLQNPRYIGSGYMVGEADGFGKVEIYVPITSKGMWGTDSSGYLYNVGGSTVSGVMFLSSGSQYFFTASGLDLPRVRLSTSTNYNYQNLFVKVTASNLQVATEYPPSILVSEAIPYLIVAMLGVVILCLMRFKH